jgi:hypothetical protein
MNGYKIISLFAALLIVGCSGVSQIAPKDLAKIDEIAKTKAIVFIKMEPKNTDRVTARIHMKRLGMAADGSVDDRFFSFDEGKNSHADVQDGYFVLVLDAVPANEALIFQAITEQKKNEPNAELMANSYDSGCGGIEGLNTISMTNIKAGIYDFGVINYEDHVSEIGEESFRYTQNFDEMRTKNFIKSKYPALVNLPITPLKATKFLNKSACPGTQTITIYM